jgi:hypothetical protein
MNNKIAAITLPMAATMQNTKAKWKEDFSTIPSCVPYTITPIRIKTPAIKQYTTPLYILPCSLIQSNPVQARCTRYHIIG